MKETKVAKLVVAKVVVRKDNGVRARDVHRGRRGRMLTSKGVSID
jgi:hypothetical protein